MEFLFTCLTTQEPPSPPTKQISINVQPTVVVSTARAHEVVSRSRLFIYPVERLTHFQDMLERDGALVLSLLEDVLASCGARKFKQPVFARWVPFDGCHSLLRPERE